MITKEIEIDGESFDLYLLTRL